MTNEGMTKLECGWATSAGIATRCEGLCVCGGLAFEGCRFAQPLATGWDGYAIRGLPASGECDVAL